MSRISRTYFKKISSTIQPHSFKFTCN